MQDTLPQAIITIMGIANAMLHFLLKAMVTLSVKSVPKEDLELLF
jgi:hypothetical protein